LIGLQVPDEEAVRLQEFLADVGYPYNEETDNPAYQMFLG
jgi:threonine dehydratase